MGAIRLRLLTILVLLFWQVGCANLPTVAERQISADRLAAQHRWQKLTLATSSFAMQAYMPAMVSNDEALTVYFEGDGLAWRTRSQPSDDPTPVNPVGLRLALAQPEGNAVYLARPCQYTRSQDENCQERYWTEARFAPEVIVAANQAVDQLKRRFAANRLTFVGYSGGAAVAALVAARRHDVERLITVAGNLDHAAWTAYHRVRPLKDSLNPTDEIPQLAKVHQWHFVGGKDRVIKPELINGFARRFPDNTQLSVVVEPEFDHQCCWVENWQILYFSTEQ
jgi:dienelactone hydrolase